MDEKTTQAIISWSITIVQLIATILIVWSGKGFRKRLLKWQREKYNLFTNRQLAMLIAFKKASTNRTNLLSKENAKLIEENEKLRGKLKNLGFSDITLDN
jgi:Trk-type K+ transport system membrane component